jgi:cytidine deaminase
MEGPELIIGMVGAIGTDMNLVSEVLQDELTGVKYTTSLIRLSDLLHQIDKFKGLPTSPADVRWDRHMTAGTLFRKRTKRGDAMALLAVTRIKNERRRLNRARPGESSRSGRNSNAQNRPVRSHAYILRSLKHPDEVRSLRRIYGRAFWLISAYSSREQRLDAIAEQIATTRFDSDKTKYRSKAEQLILRDEEETSTEFGQDVKDAFPLGDIFLRADSRKSIQSGVSRFIELLFGHPYHTPTRDEVGMFYARASALRSSDLSRQVGAAISTQQGDIVAVGCNEVPKANGGLYWPGERDFRDFQVGYDTSVRVRKEILSEILQRLKDAGWLSASKSNKDINGLVKAALRGGNNALMQGARLMNVLEFGRMVHAEMAALADSARRGLRVQGANLYTTTFPCHICARHIVASGIRRVVYVEPYPKSMAKDLYPDSISVDAGEQTDDHVNFESFVGVAPRRFAELFDPPLRKDKEGKIINWRKLGPAPRLARIVASYLLIENDAILLLSETMKQRALKFVT